jgi:undecaprenyl-diphosphatase
MMDLLHLVLLGILQGLTEFLPVSSSAHLILLPELLEWQDQGLVYDIAAHVGSLAAVVIYLRHDLLTIFTAWTGSLSGKPRSHDSLMFWYLLVATLPAALGGYLLYDFVAAYLRSPLVIAATTVIFGVLLWWADVRGKRLRDISSIRFADVLIIGMAQMVSIVPGVSRSGITMTAGLFLGLDRRSAARFSFLMAIPVILLAGGYEGYRYLIGGSGTNWIAFLTVAAAAGVTAWLAMHLFLEFLNRTGMLPYVVYRLLLGVFLYCIFS